ncbi:DNA-directed RNA polymerase subunit E'' [Methanocalculus chunghsingensis]|uniref:Transcription elongation factor Spt4 n=1 Tax=Methanocalculus chunghsingensis TaxID=156457 RepID=A0A8J7WB50_9EURY|nr:transcription elongation factor subunit Spt4 [Methanocalculus chunghsingensis]MBR1369695.1 DNA-directed RNA polymerase subunit E'' [Methanocalculus chunghsingensis]
MAARKKVDHVCRKCHRVLDADKEACIICGDSSLSTDWQGYLIIIDPKRSEIAEKMNIDLPGRYALKVR